MVRIIFFKREEKLAILKIMIELNNHGYFLYGRGLKFIQDTANFLDMSNGMSEAYLMSIPEAKNIIENALKNDEQKTRFVNDVFQYMVCLEKNQDSYRRHCEYINSITDSRFYYSYSECWANPLCVDDYHIIKDNGVNSFSGKETLYKDL